MMKSKLAHMKNITTVMGNKLTSLKNIMATLVVMCKGRAIQPVPTGAFIVVSGERPIIIKECGRGMTDGASILKKIVTAMSPDMVVM